MSSSASDHSSTLGKSPAFQFYANDFYSGTIDMPAVDVGVYIRFLCYQWEKGSVPADVTVQARIGGVSKSSMGHIWERLSRHFVATDDGTYVNARLERVRQDQIAYRRRQSDKGKASAANRKATGRQPEGNRSSTGTQPDGQPKGNSSTFSLQSSPSRFTKAAAAPTDARSKHPVYQSDRFAVFEWQIDELSKTLGPHFEAFDLHSFFDDLTQKSRKDGLVIPKPEVWSWLQAQVLAEAKRRGLPFASTTSPAADRTATIKADAERLRALLEADKDRYAGR